MTGATAVIVGAAESDDLGLAPETSAIELHAQAIRSALAQGGLSAADVDGLATARMSPVDVAHYTGIRPRWVDGTNVGGCSYLLHVRHAIAALTAGHCSVVVVAHGESGRSGIGHPTRPVDLVGAAGQFERPYGVSGPPTAFTLPAMRFLHETGTTHEQLASVAVAQRRWSARTARATMRELITVEDVFASRLVAYPFHLLECCLRSDGGGALVLTTSERAADLDLRWPAVTVLGGGEALDAPAVSMMDDLTRSVGFRRAGADAFASAGIGPADVDHLMVYDAFAHLPLYGLEDLGFVGRGEAGAFVEAGETSPGGRLPMNTNGGGLSYVHTGMYGMFAIQESVRQLQGRAEAQSGSPEVAFVLGAGGMFASAAALVLGRA